MPQNTNLSKPNPQPKQPLSLAEKHDLALAKVAKFTRAVSLPNLTPDEMALAVSMLRSARAALICSQRALEYAKPHSDPEVEQRLRLYRLFRLPLPAPTT
jgi:hypothetical protein